MARPVFSVQVELVRVNDCDRELPIIDLGHSHDVVNVHFIASREAMDIEGLGDAIIEDLVKQGWVSDFADLYTLTKSNLLTLEGFKDKKATNLLASILNSKQRTLNRFIHGLLPWLYAFDTY